MHRSLHRAQRLHSIHSNAPAVSEERTVLGYSGASQEAETYSNHRGPALEECREEVLVEQGEAMKDTTKTGGTCVSSPLFDSILTVC